MPELSDPEIICAFMGWCARKDQCPICGWKYAISAAAGCVPGNCSQRPRPKSRVSAVLVANLDALWEVQNRLTDKQSREYDHLLYCDLVNSKAKFLYTWHATAEQKIRTLASVLRPIVEVQNA